jgi:hypothetical protein
VARLLVRAGYGAAASGKDDKQANVYGAQAYGQGKQDYTGYGQQAQYNAYNQNYYQQVGCGVGARRRGV